MLIFTYAVIAGLGVGFILTYLLLTHMKREMYLMYDKGLHEGRKTGYEEGLYAGRCEVFEKSECVDIETYEEVNKFLAGKGVMVIYHPTHGMVLMKDPRSETKGREQDEKLNLFPRRGRKRV